MKWMTSGRDEKKVGDESRRPVGRDREDKDHLDELLDEGLDETFPASDPVEVTQPRRRSPRGK